MQDTAFYKLLTDNTLHLSPLRVGTPIGVSSLFAILKNAKEYATKTKFKHPSIKEATDNL